MKRIRACWVNYGRNWNLLAAGRDKGGSDYDGNRFLSDI